MGIVSTAGWPNPASQLTFVKSSRLYVGKNKQVNKNAPCLFLSVQRFLHSCRMTD